ncbi:MAG: TolC family protein [Planctomycetes bacterium]|nr:TolC family protein [Planctomycetota bacterium]
MLRRGSKYRLFAVLTTAAAIVPAAWAQNPSAYRGTGRQQIHDHSPGRAHVFLPEQRHIQVRAAQRLPTYPVADSPRPRTVSHRGVKVHQVNLSLDAAIRIALENSRVVRVLAGETAVSSGRTIYDAAITNTTIDEQRARFDPSVAWRHDFNQSELPTGLHDATDPNLARIDGTRSDDYNMSLDVSKTTRTGGTFNLGVNTNPARFRPGVFPLNPQNRSSIDLSYTQPLYRGGGLAANRAPIVLAHIDTERSYYQYKDSIQEMVRGVIAAYWALVFARTDAWAREQQVKQAEFAYERANGRFQAKSVSRGVVAQARVSLGNFRTTLTGARNNVLQREAALRNLLGLPPSDGKRLVPVTPPVSQPAEFDWHTLVSLGEQKRPDVIELKLIIEADEQQLVLARNQLHPSIDATMLYRWNGLEGTTPTGAVISTGAGQFTDWTLGVSFSMPLSLRRERAALRRQQLILARDRARLRQGLHHMTHVLATNLRNLAMFHKQYREFSEIREDARLNLQERRARWSAGGVGGISYVDLLLAITDWGNTISSEAAALARYNTELANIQRETGTILETHQIRFYQERLESIGPFGRLGDNRSYPKSLRPRPNSDRYITGDRPAEDYFDLDDRVLSPPTYEHIPVPNERRAITPFPADRGN